MTARLEECRFCGGTVADKEQFETALRAHYEHAAAIGRHQALQKVVAAVEKLVADLYLSERPTSDLASYLRSGLLRDLRAKLKDAAVEREAAAKAKANGCHP